MFSKTLLSFTRSIAMFPQNKVVNNVELSLYTLFLLSNYINHLFFNTTAVVFLWASQVGIHICLNIIHLHKHKTAFPNKINKTNYISSPVHCILLRAKNMSSKMLFVCPWTFESRLKKQTKKKQTKKQVVAFDLTCISDLKYVQSKF